jgi:type I restriction enzyme S subunit
MTSIEETKALSPWIEALPSDWLATRLDAVADVLFSNVDKHTIEGEVPVRLCNYVDVYKNERITGGLDFMEASAELREIEKFQIRRHDVLATKDSEEPDDIAIAALVVEDLPGVLCGYHLAMIRPRSKRVIGSFIAWAHASKQFRAQYEANAVGVTRFGLAQHAFRAARFPLPPLSEQERIVAFLDASCMAIDPAVAAKRQQIDILDDLQRVSITKVVTRGLDEQVQLKDSGVFELGQIPAHWRRTKLRYELSVRSGDFASDKLEDNGEYPVIGGNGEMGRAARYNVDGEIVVIGRVGAYCGNAHYMNGRAWISDNALIVESNHDKRFLTHLIRVLDFNSTAKKTAQPLVTGTQIKNTYIAMPPVAEQEEIVAFIEKKTAQFASLREALLSQITSLTAYRKSMIHECVTGQRQVTDEDLKRVKSHG